MPSCSGISGQRCWADGVPSRRHLGTHLRSQRRFNGGIALRRELAHGNHATGLERADFQHLKFHFIVLARLGDERDRCGKAGHLRAAHGEPGNEGFTCRDDMLVKHLGRLVDGFVRLAGGHADDGWWPPPYYEGCLFAHLACAAERTLACACFKLNPPAVHPNVRPTLQDSHRDPGR